LVFLRELPSMTNLWFKLYLGLSHSYKEYVEHLQQKFDHIAKTVLHLQQVNQDSQNERIAQQLDKCPLLYHRTVGMPLQTNVHQCYVQCTVIQCHMVWTFCSVQDFG
jgi:uncharacterized short protein YbdD (DUF466 family)